MRPPPLIAIALVAGLAGAASANARQVRYVGIHPVPRAAGGGFCEIEAPHVHVFEGPTLEYRTHDGHQFFVGDPVAYGFDGPRHPYKGHHPIHVHAVVGDEHDDVEFCYLDGAHFHAFAPAVAADFEVVGDTYFYVAEPPPVYLEMRPTYVKINAIYTPLRYQRPVVTVTPPSAWIGVRAGYAMPVAAVDVRGAVVAPGVRAEVYVPAPSLEVSIGIGGGFGVGVGEVHGPRGRHRHDRGKHKGWGKKKKRGFW